MTPQSIIDAVFGHLTFLNADVIDVEDGDIKHTDDTLRETVDMYLQPWMSDLYLVWMHGELLIEIDMVEYRPKPNGVCVRLPANTPSDAIDALEAALMLLGIKVVNRLGEGDMG